MGQSDIRLVKLNGHCQGATGHQHGRRSTGQGLSKTLCLGGAGSHLLQTKPGDRCPKSQIAFVEVMCAIPRISGVSPEVATLGSVTFARYVVQVALQYEFNAQEIPDYINIGDDPQGSSAPVPSPFTPLPTSSPPVATLHTPARLLADETPTRVSPWATKARSPFKEAILKTKLLAGASDRVPN